MKTINLQGNNSIERKEWLRELLLNDTYNVTFTKVNGETRVMPCTLKEGVVPPPPVHITNTDNPIDFPKVRKSNPDALSVWCVDKQEWRSFRVMSVTSIGESMYGK